MSRSGTRCAGSVAVRMRYGGLGRKAPSVLVDDHEADAVDGRV